jgi:hypothetical protein
MTPSATSTLQGPKGDTGAANPGVAADTIWDAKGDIVVATAADTAAKLAVGADYSGLVAEAAQASGLRWVPGASVLLYDYTVAGADKASIDTGVDTPNAGIAGTSAFGAAWRVLQIYFIGRSDDTASAFITLDWILNNDTSSIYDLQNLEGFNATAAASQTKAQASWGIYTHGTVGSASYPSVTKMEIPGYAGSTFYKVAKVIHGGADDTNTNMATDVFTLGYRSASPITRLKIASRTTKKLKIGSRLMIYAK